MYETIIYLTGCSCGCTPGQSILVTADTEEAFIRSLAYCASNHMVYGKDPFKKVDLGKANDEFGVRVFDMAMRIHTLYKRILKLEKCFGNKEEPVKYFPAYISHKGYKLTKEQIQINKELKEKWETRQSRAFKLIDMIHVQINMYKNSGEYEYDYYEIEE